MILGISFETFTTIHVVISLFAILAGAVAVYGMLKARRMPGWTFVFLWLTVLTCATGFPLPPFGWDPPRIIGVITLLLLAGSIGALYIFRLDGSWRLVYVATAFASLYLNVFVLVVQGFLKVPFITAFAPTQSELPFLIAHILVLAIFVCLGFMALGRFRPRR